MAETRMACFLLSSYNQLLNKPSSKDCPEDSLELKAKQI